MSNRVQRERFEEIEQERHEEVRESRGLRPLGRNISATIASEELIRNETIFLTTTAKSHLIAPFYLEDWTIEKIQEYSYEKIFKSIVKQCLNL